MEATEQDMCVYIYIYIDIHVYVHDMSKYHRHNQHSVRNHGQINS